MPWRLRSLFLSTAIIADMHRLGGTSSPHMYALLFLSQRFGQHVYLALARCDRRRSYFKERLCVVSLRLLHLRFSLVPEYEFHIAQVGTVYWVVALRAHDFTPARTGHAPGLFRFLFQPSNPTRMAHVTQGWRVPWPPTFERCRLFGKCACSMIVSCRHTTCSANRVTRPSWYAPRFTFFFKFVYRIVALALSALGRSNEKHVVGGLVGCRVRIRAYIHI